MPPEPLLPPILLGSCPLVLLHHSPIKFHVNVKRRVQATVVNVQTITKQMERSQLSSLPIVTYKIEAWENSTAAIKQ